MAGRRRAGPTKGFQAIKKHEVGRIKARGGRTAGGKAIRNPEAYVAAGLRRTGIAKLGPTEFARRQRAGRRRHPWGRRKLAARG